MASKVNTKFVAVLAGALILVFVGVAGTWFWLKNKSGDDAERKGDQAMSAGDYKNAEAQYSRAVNKQQANITRIAKWRDAIGKLTPETQTEYENKYRTSLTMATRQLAVVQRTDVKAHRDWLELNYERVTAQGFSTEAMNYLVTETDASLNFFEGQPDGPWHTLRRYSGLALVRIMVFSDDVTQAQIDRAKSDLDIARKADPKDVDVALALVDWHNSQASRLGKSGKLDEQKAMAAAGSSLMTELVAQFPNEPAVLIAAAREKIQVLARSSGLEQATDAEQQRLISLKVQEGLRAMKPELDALAAVLTAYDPAKFRSDWISQFSGVEGAIDPAGIWSRARAIAAAMIAKRPDDAGLLNLHANMLGQAGLHEEAISQYQKILDLPRKPVSTDGMRLFDFQAGAAIARTDLAVQHWFAQTTPEGRQASMERVKKFRADVTQRGIREDVAPLLLVDAKTKVAEQDWASANKFLVRYFENPGRDRDTNALLIHAQVLSRLNQPGAAKQTAERLMALEPGNSTAYKIYAQSLIALDDLDRAKQILEAVVEDNPDDTESKELLARIEQTRDPSKITDPVARSLAELSKSVNEPGGSKDITPRLQSMAEEHGYDPRIAFLLAQRQAEAQNIEDARATIKKSLEKHPDSEVLKRLDTALNATDQAEALVQMVDAGTGEPVEKAIRKYQILRGFGRRDDASQMLKKARAESPNDTGLMELDFLEAIERKDLDAANKITEIAAQRDADGAEGLTYRARVFLMQERIADAASTLTQATSRRTANPETWRLLARVQTRLGRDAEASRAYEEALKLRPNDRTTLIEYLNYLSGSDADRALIFARENLKFGENDPEFSDAWLRLEGRVGDKSTAIKKREEIKTREAENVNNIGALAGLYIDTRDWDKARALIDQLREKIDNLPVTMLDARWNAERGRIEETKKVMEDFLARQDQSKLTYEPFLAFGQFLVQRRLPDEGLAMMERARPYQDAKRLEVDRVIGDTLSSLGRSDAAAVVYERILAAGSEDPNDLVKLRLTEMYLRDRKFKEADGWLAKMNAPTRTDSATLMLLAADAAMGLGDERRAREYLDRAVATFPTDPMVYCKRAEVLATRPELRSDAMTDLDAALRARPGFARALQQRAQLHVSNNDMDRAIADLQELVRQNPQMEEIRDGLVRDLLRRGKNDQAIQVADEAINARKGDTQTMLRMSDIFRSAEQWRDSARFAKSAWEVNKTYDIGIRYLESLLNGPGGNLTEAEGVLTTFKEEIDKRPGLLLARAKLAMRRARPGWQDAARKDLTASLALLTPDFPARLVAWSQDVRRVFSKPGEASAYYMEAARSSPLRDWVLFFRAQLLGSDPTTLTEGISELDSLLASASDENVAVLSHRLKGSTYFSMGDHQKAAEAWQAGLKKYPDDWEMNNNLAYTLSKFLKRHEEALPFAEQGVKSNPGSADALDTLGSVLLATNKLPEAERVLMEAVAQAGNSTSRVPAMIHLGTVKLKQGDRDRAAKILQDLDMIFGSGEAGSVGQYRPDLEEFRAAVEVK